MKKWERLLVALGLLAGGSLLWAHAGGTVHELPEPIAKVVKQAFPEADITRVNRDEDDGEIEYDIRLKTRPDGREIEVEFRTETGLTRTEEQLRQEQIPPRVRKALQKAFPKARIKDGRKRSEIRVTYEVNLLVDGKRTEVTFSPRGKILEVDKQD